MQCKCVEQINKQLEERNTRIIRHITFNFDTRQGGISPPEVLTEKIDTKKRARKATILCSYCPFCGKSCRPPRRKK